MKAEEIFSLGYAVPNYDIEKQVRRWRYRDEQYTLPTHAVRLVQLPGVRFYVGHIDEVRKAANG